MNVTFVLSSAGVRRWLVVTGGGSWLLLSLSDWLVAGGVCSPHHCPPVPTAGARSDSGHSQTQTKPGSPKFVPTPGKKGISLRVLMDRSVQISSWGSADIIWTGRRPSGAAQVTGKAIKLVKQENTTQALALTSLFFSSVNYRAWLVINLSAQICFLSELLLWRKCL